MEIGWKSKTIRIVVRIFYLFYSTRPEAVVLRRVVFVVLYCRRPVSQGLEFGLGRVRVRGPAA